MASFRSMGLFDACDKKALFEDDQTSGKINARPGSCSLLTADLNDEKSRSNDSNRQPFILPTGRMPAPFRRAGIPVLHCHHCCYFEHASDVKLADNSFKPSSKKPPDTMIQRNCIHLYCCTAKRVYPSEGTATAVRRKRERLAVNLTAHISSATAAPGFAISCCALAELRASHERGETFKATWMRPDIDISRGCVDFYRACLSFLHASSFTLE